MWDAIALQRLEESCSERARASAAALVLAEGVANLCLLTDSMTLTKAHITQAIPRKRKASTSHHDKSLERFFQSCFEAMLRYVEWKTVKVVVIASPGFVKDQFHQFLLDSAVRLDSRDIIENKSKIMLVHSSSGHKHSLTEVLRDKTVQAQMIDTKAAKEVLSLTKFYDMLKKEPDRAVYGYNHVNISAQSAAVETLLLSDNLFRAKNVNTRKMYVELVELVKQQGGEALIFSSLHVSGEQLAQLSGVAAILRFPIPGLDDQLEDEPEPFDDVDGADLTNGAQDQLQPRFHMDQSGEQRQDDAVGLNHVNVTAFEDDDDVTSVTERAEEDVDMMMEPQRVNVAAAPKPQPAKQPAKPKPSIQVKKTPKKGGSSAQYLDDEDDDFYGDDDEYY
jgi:mRNA surveillance protein pelota